MKIFADMDYSIAYFFCDDKDERLKITHAILANVLAQLLSQDPNSLFRFFNKST